MARPAFVFAAALLAAVSLHANAFAQSNQAMAETLFQDGRRLMTAGQYAEACPKLEESQRLDPGTGTLLNWGLCLKELGKPASAWVVFNQAVASARAENRADRVALADAEIKKLEAVMPRLSVTVAPEADLPDLTVKVDSATLAPAARGVASPVDPGQHVVTASASGRKTWTNTVDVKPGAQTHTVVVPVLEPLSAPQPVAGSLVGVTGGGPAEAQAAPPPPRVKRWLAGARVNLAIPMGKSAEGINLSDYAATQGGFWFEGGYKVHPSILVGAFLGLGFGGMGDANSVATISCDQEGVSCAAMDLRIGLQGTYTFMLDGLIQPWAGLGFGYEVLQFSLEHGDSHLTESGVGAELLMLQGGVDFNLNAVTVGPFLAFTLGRYTSGSVSCEGSNCSSPGTTSYDVESPTVHSWFQIGVRGTFGF